MANCDVTLLLYGCLQMREWELVKMKFGVDILDTPVHLKLEYSLMEVSLTL
jgi:hypothetical protein